VLLTLPLAFALNPQAVRQHLGAVGDAGTRLADLPICSRAQGSGARGNRRMRVPCPMACKADPHVHPRVYGKPGHRARLGTPKPAWASGLLMTWARCPMPMTSCLDCGKRSPSHPNARMSRARLRRWWGGRTLGPGSGCKAQTPIRQDSLGARHNNQLSRGLARHCRSDAAKERRSGCSKTLIAPHMPCETATGGPRRRARLLYSPGAEALIGAASQRSAR
jgi:hypothetical protein